MKIVLLPALMATLAACSSSTTTTTTPTTPTGSVIGSASQGAGGAYQVVQGSVTTNIPAPTGTAPTLNGVKLDRWSNVGGITAAGYTDVDVTAAGGVNNGTYFAGISGATSPTLPMTGTASYTGRYSLIVSGNSFSANLDLTADFAAGTLADSSPTIVVNGTITGGNVAGTVDFLGQSGTLKGGFYSGVTGGVVGSVLGTNIAGVIVAN